MKAAAKDGWHAKPLEEIATFSNGLWKGKKGPFRKAKVLRNTNFRLHGAISFDDIAEIDVECKQFEKRRLRNGDIIVERSGGGPKQPVGRVVLFELEDDNYSFSNFTSIIRVVDQSRLDPRFLHQVLNWWHFAGWTEKIQSRSTGIRNLDFKAYKQFLVPLPPLEEQRRIVAVLDEAFEGLNRARAHVEAGFRDAKELFANWSANAFEAIASSNSIQTVSVKNMVLPTKGSIRTGPFGSQLLHSEFVEQGIAVLGIDNAVSNKFRWGKRRYVTVEKYDQLRRYTVHPGDVIITIMGTCGRCAVIPDDIPTAINTKHLCCISLDPKKCLPEYLHRYFLLSPRARSYLSTGASGSVMDGLNMGIIKEMPVELPNIGKQQELVARVAEFETHMNAVLANYQAQESDIDDLRQSILQRAFAGELT